MTTDLLMLNPCRLRRGTAQAGASDHLPHHQLEGVVVRDTKARSGPVLRFSQWPGAPSPTG
jgi:hypothetical protein